jgi:hypothetical protein
VKIVINKQHGGFSLSIEAFESLLKRKGIEFEKSESEFGGDNYYTKGHAGDNNYYISQYDYFEPRNDPDLIAVIEEFGDEANGRAASLKIVEVPDDVEWQIDDYDGWEWVAEKHRTWE